MFLYSRGECKARALDEAADFEAKFLVFDTWIRFFDGEPLPAVCSQPAAKEEPEKDAEREAENEKDADQPEDEAASECPKETPKEVPRFAKYKRLKEALALFAERFGCDPFSSVVPALLKAAVELADESKSASQLPLPPQPKVAKPCRIRREPITEASDDVSPKEGAMSEATEQVPVDKAIHLSASDVYSLLANAALLNVQGFFDLQKLYLSSAKAAPQKILCLLAYFHLGLEVTCGREIVFERTASSDQAIRDFLPDPISPPDPEPKQDGGDLETQENAEAGEKTSQEATSDMKDVKEPLETAEPAEPAKPAEPVKPVEPAELDTKDEALDDSGNEGGQFPAVAFASDFATALDGCQGAVIILSSASSFGALADVKTPPEEVPLWEFPELLCSRLVLGSLPLADAQVAIVRGVRRVNSCTTEGPLLNLAEGPRLGAVLDIAVMDIQRHIDDRRFAIESLRHDATKWSTCIRCLAKDVLAVGHPPLIGVDRHWSYAMQLLSAGVSASSTALKLRYALSTEGYATAVASTELSPAQVKEAKHLEALTNRMASASSSWRPRDLLRLLALFPYARSSDSEKFHAFWTQRLRDKTLERGGCPTKSEVAGISSRQAELWPPEPVKEPSPEPPKPPKVEEPPPDASAPLAQSDDQKQSGWNSAPKQKEWGYYWKGHMEHKDYKYNHYRRDKTEDKRKRDTSRSRDRDRKAWKVSPETAQQKQEPESKEEVTLALKTQAEEFARPPQVTKAMFLVLLYLQHSRQLFKMLALRDGRCTEVSPAYLKRASSEPEEAVEVPGSKAATRKLTDSDCGIWQANRDKPGFAHHYEARLPEQESWLKEPAQLRRIFVGQC
ncbi:rpsF [Symbiodinium pilosum]|uniref:RpsF protein n=1 Tax=Symbiodinium pilosum TaxID=2952 RepID=A0A812KTZ1_SYMPI|nr:rpsF [Symbiodinium pilosum]